MLGAIVGDIIGSVHEGMGTKTKNFHSSFHAQYSPMIPSLLLPSPIGFFPEKLPRVTDLTEMSAYGFVDRIYSGYQVGSRALAGLLERIDVSCHIHGHIHHSFGRDENHFNVAADGRCRAMIIDLHSLSHKVIQA